MRCLPVPMRRRSSWRPRRRGLPLARRRRDLGEDSDRLSGFVLGRSDGQGRHGLRHGHARQYLAARPTRARPGPSSTRPAPTSRSPAAFSLPTAASCSWGLAARFSIRRTGEVHADLPSRPQGSERGDPGRCRQAAGLRRGRRQTPIHDPSPKTSMSLCPQPTAKAHQPTSHRHPSPQHPHRLHLPAAAVDALQQRLNFGNR